MGEISSRSERRLTWRPIPRIPHMSQQQGNFCRSPQTEAVLLQRSCDGGGRRQLLWGTRLRLPSKAAHRSLNASSALTAKHVLFLSPQAASIFKITSAFCFCWDVHHGRASFFALAVLLYLFFLWSTDSF